MEKSLFFVSFDIVFNCLSDVSILILEFIVEMLFLSFFTIILQISVVQLDMVVQMMFMFGFGMYMFVFLSMVMVMNLQFFFMSMMFGYMVGEGNVLILIFMVE